MPTRIVIEIPDNLIDADKRIGAVITAARHARGTVTIDDARTCPWDDPAGRPT